MTTTLYHCPECDRIHDEPFTAGIGIFAVCFDCATDEDWREAAAPTLPRAA